MRTLFETSWVRNAWSPNMGQAAALPGSDDFFGSLVSAGSDILTSRYEAEEAEDIRRAKEAEAAAAQARAQAAAAAAAVGPRTILGMSPTTATIVGVATLAAIIGGVALLSKKRK